MLSVSLGPLALPVAPLILLLSVWVAASVAGRLVAPESRAKAENTVWYALLLGMLAARLGYVLPIAALYLATPWTLLDLRDGGWLAPAGLAGGAAWLAWRAWQWPAARRALGLAALTGVTLWGGASAVVWWADGGTARPQAPAVMLTEAATGQVRSLPDVIRGQPAVVNLWASWCGPCRIEMPDLAAAQLREPGVRFIFVNQGESAQVIQTYLQRAGLTLQNVWMDNTSSLGPAVGSQGLPTTLFFDARGRLVDAHFGVINPAALQAKIQSLK
ncbi:TlpA family protein disulfide reductase [Rhodoferax sp. U2-2l]|uniref:TlpA family protein disulfide reductase n=1 Tax=Rhodoferax sp. U2-2l TaxID=2884000 RepID=UPI001D0B7027|nr:TlpA family protein disulfide reductase [Rhodoferax sp. U2-2l]MCB8747992.1 TlpA family protein disulfide reductase [Rhodoferax sp. U2-2l]